MTGNGPIRYFDIPVADPARARAFWGGLFGWTFDTGFPGYDMIHGSAPAGGLDATAGPGPVRPHFHVDDVPAALARVAQLGGSTEEPRTGPTGTLARCRDDQGTVFTLADLTVPSTEPTGGPIVFFDLPVADAARARAFWGGLFGWRFVDGNFPGYDMIEDAALPAGLDATSGPGPIRLYFGVDDIDTATKTVAALGGAVATTMTLPSGTLARCTDDQDTPFTLWQQTT